MRASASAPSFTASRRRAQIVAATIETIAELGADRASFAQIARRAGLSSTGLISYHFASREELLAAVVSDVVGRLEDHLHGRLHAAASPPEALRTYLTASCEFIGEHRTDMAALLAVFLAGGSGYDATAEDRAVSPIEAILRDGHASGDYRAFDTRVMATVVQRSVDGLPFLLAAEPDLDVGAYARELATTFDLATRAGSGGR